MDRTEAIRLAIDLVQVPSRVRAARGAAMPSGMEALLRIAAGDEGAISAIASETDRSPEFLQDAASFFIEQILLAPDSDSYRVLGATSNASAADLRRNMALLFRWLHPDIVGHKDKTLFAARVASAWDDVKTAARRESYDATARSTGPRGNGSSKSGVPRSRTKRTVRIGQPDAAKQHSSFRRALSRLLGREP